MIRVGCKVAATAAGLAVAICCAGSIALAQPALPWPLLPSTAPSSPAPPADQSQATNPSAAGSQGLLKGPLTSPDTWSTLVEHLLVRIVDFLPNLLAAIVLLGLFYLFYRVLARVAHGVLHRTHADPALSHIIGRLVRYVVLGFGLVVAANQMGVEVGSLIAGLGVATLAVGLAAQDTLSNIIAGLTILWDRPFRIGDNVTIADTYGRVVQIGLRTTRIRTVERLDAILPNKDVIDQKIINHTLNPQLRLGIDLGIAYKEDPREARRVLLAAVAGHELIEDDPAPEVVVTGLGDSSVDLELRVWLKDPYTEREAKFAFTELAKLALDEAGIEIPFPQRTLHLAAGELPVRMTDGAEGGAAVGGSGGSGEPEGTPRGGARH